MQKPHTIAIIAQKGGTGKTTTTAALGAGLTRSGYSVLYIDVDPQGNLSQMLGAATTGTTVYTLLTDRKTKARDAIQATPQGAIIAASGRLAEDGILTTTGKEYRLREALEPVKNDFDIILIDCPPQLGVLSINALTAADGAIIPLKADRFSLDTLGELYQTYEVVKRYTNPSLTIMGILVTQYNSRATVNRLCLEQLQEQADALGLHIYQPPIRRTVALEEVQYTGDIFSLPKSNGAADYGAIVEQIIKQLQEG